MQPGKAAQRKAGQLFVIPVDRLQSPLCTEGSLFGNVGDPGFEAGSQVNQLLQERLQPFGQVFFVNTGPLIVQILRRIFQLHRLEV